MKDGAQCIVARNQVIGGKRIYGIRKILCPANSPDLNPIENLWKIVKDTIQKEELPQNKEELVNIIQRE
jgi:transposase